MKNHLIVKTHASNRAHQRGIPQSSFWDVDRHVNRLGLKSKLEEQHKKLAPMLNAKAVVLKIGGTHFKVSTEEISTRVEVKGTIYAIGIRRRAGDDYYTPLSCITTWN